MPNFNGLNPRLSGELLRVNWTNRCPKCRKYLARGLLSLVYLDAADNQISVRLYQQIGPDITARCPKCLATFPVWRNDSISKQASTWTVKKMVVTGHREEPIGVDKQYIDSSKTRATVVKDFTFTKEWSRTLTIESEESISRSFGVGIDDIVSIHFIAEQAVRNKYSISTTEHQSRTEKMSITIPAGTKQQVILQWKQIWEEGMVQLVDQSGRRVDIPFSVAADLTFDQRVIDQTI